MSKEMNLLSSSLCVTKKAVSRWLRHRSVQTSAALSFYAIFSMVPFMVLIIVLNNTVFAEHAIEVRLVNMFKSIDTGGEKNQLQLLLDTASHSYSGQLTLSSIFFFAGCFGFFSQIKDAFNNIWDVSYEEKNNIVFSIKNILFSYFIITLIILMSVFLILLTFILQDSSMTLYQRFSSEPFSWIPMDFIISCLILSFFFGFLFKILPDIDVPWYGALSGGFITALLFTPAKLLLGIYLSQSAILGLFGVTPSLMALLFWTYYASQILLLGGEFSRVFSEDFRS